MKGDKLGGNAKPMFNYYANAIPIKRKKILSGNFFLLLRIKKGGEAVQKPATQWLHK